MKQDGVRKKLNKVLRQQAKKTHALSRNKYASTAELFRRLGPGGQLEFFYSMDRGEFDDFVNETKDNLFDYILDGVFEKLIYGSEPRAVKLFGEMTDETINKFVNKIEDTYRIVALFNYLCFGNQVKLIKFLTHDNFEAFLVDSIKDSGCSYFFEFLGNFENDSEEEKEIYAKFSQLKPETIAGVLGCLEETDDYLVRKILQELDNQKIFEVCQTFEPTMLYDVLLKFDFSFVLNGDKELSTFICKKISKEQRQKLLDSLISMESDFNQLFDETGMAYLYMAGDFENKQYLLEHVLIDKDIKEFRKIYEICPEHDKIKLLEMMIGKPQAYEYAVEMQSVLRKNAMELLEEKGDDREFFEEIFLRYLKSEAQ